MYNIIRKYRCLTLFHLNGVFWHPAETNLSIIFKSVWHRCQYVNSKGNLSSSVLLICWRQCLGVFKEVFLFKWNEVKHKWAQKLGNTASKQPGSLFENIAKYLQHLNRRLMGNVWQYRGISQWAWVYQINIARTFPRNVAKTLPID